MTFLTIDLQMPPSSNNMFVNIKGGGRAKSKIYKDWRDAARWDVINAWRGAGRPEWAAKTPMELTIRLGLQSRRADASNYIKAIEDVLVAELPIPDDRYNDRIVIERDESIPGLARVTIGTLGLAF